MQINREADVKLEVARIDADSKIRAAEIQRASDKAIETLTAKLEALAAQMEADTSGEGGTATGGKAKAKDQSGALGMTMNVTGNVSLQSNSAQIESSTVNVETPSVGVNADSVALQSDKTQIDGSPTVNVAGDLNATNTVIEKTVAAMPPSIMPKPKKL
jgi:phage baseplate assembly protein gpV